MSPTKEEMMERRRTYNQGQAMVEVALFSGIILVVLTALIAYIQQINDMDYLKKEAFRRALQKATTFQGKMSEAPGASVQIVPVENRRHADINSEFGKGVTQQILSDTANVYWAVPTDNYYRGDPQGASKKVVLGRVNDEEVEVSEFPAQMYINQEADLAFYEEKQKTENMNAMAHTRQSLRQEELKTNFPGVNITQNSYRDTDLQYRYSKEAPQAPVERQMTWQTAD